MTPIEIKELEDLHKKPSLNSVMATRERMKMLEQAADDAESYTETERKLMEDEKQMSIVAHLSELRKRIIISVLAILIGFGIAYYFVDTLLEILVAPAGKLYYLRPTEAFFTYLKVALAAGLVGSSPIWIYELWAFIVPALTTRERRLTNWFIPVVIVLFFCGVLFSYFLVLPAAIRFFIGFSTDELQPMFSIGMYVDFVLSFILPFGVIFELPLIVMGLAQLGLVDSEFLKKQRKIFILLAFVIGAVVSPTPDVFSQTMIALPMLVLYEVGVFIVSKIMRK